MITGVGLLGQLRRSGVVPYEGSNDPSVAQPVSRLNTVIHIVNLRDVTVI